MAGAEKKEFRLEAYGEVFCQGIEIIGSRQGKTLAVTAGVHGREYVGIQALLTLAREIRPEEIRGRLILFPVMNVEGFYQGTRRVIPSDGVNLNRAFPGDRHGTKAWRLAAAVEEKLYPEIDFLLDLHGGDDNEMAMPFAYFPACASAEVTEASRRAAAALSLSVRVASSAKNGLYSQAAQQGIPALLLERGGGGRWFEEEIEGCQNNIRELMVHLGIFEPEKETEGEEKPTGKVESAWELHGRQQEIQNTEYMASSADGVWYPAVTAGQHLKAGDLVGELCHISGERIHRYVSAQEGVVLYYTTALGVKAGDSLAAVGFWHESKIRP